MSHSALDPARPLVFVDIETTGGSPATSRILEVAAIRVESGCVTGNFTTLLNPDEPIPPFISELTGIVESDVSSAPFFNQIAWELYDFLETGVFVAHNVSFDMGFMQAEYRRLGVDFGPDQLCTVRLSRYFYPHFATHKLGALIERHSLSVADRHRAEADAQAIADFYALLVSEFGAEAVLAARAELLHEPAPKRRRRVTRPTTLPGQLVTPGDSQ